MSIRLHVCMSVCLYVCMSVCLYKREKKQTLPSSAYNHQNHHNFPKVVDHCRQHEVFARIGSLLQCILDSSASEDAVLEHFSALEQMIMEIPYCKEFNTKEYLWHVILIHETISSNCSSPARKRFATSSPFGPGGVHGLSIFFPGIVPGSVNQTAAELKQELEEAGMFIPEMHVLKFILLVRSRPLSSPQPMAPYHDHCFRFFALML